MFTLTDFYRSKAWESLLKQLRIERLNDEGEIICEYCGKPITKAYDMIGHHKEHLTAENVNDYSVSLNPDNISFVHHACHNRLHNKLGYSAREVFIVYGAPFSGKHEYVQRVMSAGDLIVDIDSIWQCISGCERYVKPNRLKAIAFRLRDSLIEAVRYRAGKWQNAYIIGGYAVSAERLRLCRELSAREVLIESTREECFERMERVDTLGFDREMYGRFIDEWFEMYTPPD